MPPENSDREISADLPEKGKWSRKEGKSKKGRWKIENGRRKSYKMRGGLFFSFFLSFFFFFFFLLFTFQKPLKFVLGLPKWEFSTGKKHFTPGKKIRKMTLPTLKKYSCYAPGVVSPCKDSSFITGSSTRNILYSIERYF